MPLGIQVFGLVFSAFILYVSFLYYKKRQFTLIEWGFWTGFSVMFAAVSVFPQFLDPVVATLNLTRKLDLFIILGFMFLIAATFYTYTVTRRTDRRMEDVVKKMALERIDRKKKR